MTLSTGTAPMLRARKITKGIDFARPAAAMAMLQANGGVPVEMEVPGAFRVSSVRALGGRSSGAGGRAWGGLAAGPPPAAEVT
jgi:hypothetical protein